MLRLCPSSVNSQPWHFIVAESEEGKARIAKSAIGNYAANHSKIKDCSLCIVMCTKNAMTDEHLDLITEQEKIDGRFPTEEAQAMVRKARQFYADLHRVEFSDEKSWMEKQTYLNIGFMLASIASLGLDAVPIEGVDFEVINDEFSLNDKGFSATVVLAIGFAAEDDFNRALPKSRLKKELLFTEV